MIDVGASGALAELPFSLYNDTTGAPVIGHTFVDAGGGLTAEVKLRLPAGTFANSTIANIVEWGNGQYALQLTAGQTVTAGKVSIYVLVTGCSANYSPEEIKASNTAANIVAALMAYEHDTGATFLGLCNRLDALIAGKATGLRGALARYYMRDGATVAISAVQDVGSGTRATGDITGSE